MPRLAGSTQKAPKPKPITVTPTTTAPTRPTSPEAADQSNVSWVDKPLSKQEIRAAANAPELRGYAFRSQNPAGDNLSPRQGGAGGGGDGGSTPQPVSRESGGKAGKWELGATGQWQQETPAKTRPRTAPKPRPTGALPAPTSGFRNQVIDRSGVRDAGSEHGVYEVGRAGEGGGVGAGGGGTGNPLAALGSAIKNLNLKGAEFGGESVEEVTSFGARKTRKTGAKRSV